MTAACYTPHHITAPPCRDGVSEEQNIVPRSHQESGGCAQPLQVWSQGCPDFPLAAQGEEQIHGAHFNSIQFKRCWINPTAPFAVGSVLEWRIEQNDTVCESNSVWSMGGLKKRAPSLSQPHKCVLEIQTPFWHLPDNSSFSRLFLTASYGFSFYNNISCGIPHRSLLFQRRRLSNSAHFPPGRSSWLCNSNVYQHVNGAWHLPGLHGRQGILLSLWN